MEYRNTFLLPNQYPNFANYDKNLNGDIVLTGIYEENFITDRFYIFFNEL